MSPDQFWGRRKGPKSRHRQATLGRAVPGVEQGCRRSIGDQGRDEARLETRLGALSAWSLGWPLGLRWTAQQGEACEDTRPCYLCMFTALGVGDLGHLLRAWSSFSSHATSLSARLRGARTDMRLQYEAVVTSNAHSKREEHHGKTLARATAMQTTASGTAAHSKSSLCKTASCCIPSRPYPAKKKQHRPFSKRCPYLPSRLHS